ncbi:hypothetical protein FACS189441_2470 [Betaproteobacteria bacterium]|nr:hypothetical protein FACS189441_2470 [Betaproteobacteria bacterium]
MSRIISALLMAVATATAAVAIAAEPIPLASNAPERYTVVKGDTLWGIAGKFLKDPWRWPDIWQLNKAQIKNPHWIYPGDIVFLDYVDGQPRLRLGKNLTGSGGNQKLSPEVHSELIDKAIPSIPPNAIEAFISRPLVVELDELQDAPRVIGTDESRVIMGNGDEIYALGIKENHPKWYVYRLGAPLKTPLPPEDSTLTDKEILGPVLRYLRTPTYKDAVEAPSGGNPGDVLGYEVLYLGTAQLKEPGNVSTLEILSSKEEILKGDLLIPAEEPTLNSYVPHVVDEEVSGQVVSVHGGVGVGGKFSIVALNLGENVGIERGHVLGIFTKRNTVYEDKDSGRNKTVELPEKRNGVVFIFRVFNRVSYGLVMEAARPVVTGDSVKNP